MLLFNGALCVQFVVALYDFAPDEPSDLPFKQGDRIRVRTLPLRAVISIVLDTNLGSSDPLSLRSWLTLQMRTGGRVSSTARWARSLPPMSSLPLVSEVAYLLS